MSVGMVAGAVAVVGGAAISANAQKKAAKKQAAAADRATDAASEQYYQTRDDLMPYQDAGKYAIGRLGEVMEPINRTQALSDFYSGSEYAMMNSQANNNLMASAEATGGMGGSTNANNLMRIAPTLGMQHLGMLEGQKADQYNQLMGMANMGQNAAAQTGNAGMNYATQAGNAYQNAAAAQAASGIAQANTMGNALGSLAGMAYQAYNQPSQSSTNYNQGMGQLGYNSMGGF